MAPVASSLDVVESADKQLRASKNPVDGEYIQRLGKVLPELMMGLLSRDDAAAALGTHLDAASDLWLNVAIIVYVVDSDGECKGFFPLFHRDLQDLAQHGATFFKESNNSTPCSNFGSFVKKARNIVNQLQGPPRVYPHQPLPQNIDQSSRVIMKCYISSFDASCHAPKTRHCEERIFKSNEHSKASLKLLLSRNQQERKRGLALLTDPRDYVLKEAEKRRGNFSHNCFFSNIPLDE